MCTASSGAAGARGPGCPTEGEATALVSGLSQEPGLPWPGGPSLRCPRLRSLVWRYPEHHSSVWEPSLMPPVSVSLHGFLTLTNIALGLFKLNFFSLRKTKQSHSIQWLQKLSQAGVGHVGGEGLAALLRPPALGPGLPALSLPSPGATSEALGQDLGGGPPAGTACAWHGARGAQGRRGALWSKTQMSM